MQYLNERSWLDLLEQGITSYLTWPKRNDKGQYNERFKGFSYLMKSTRIFVFNDSMMQQLAPSPVFTDGLNIYLHERVANECWHLGQDNEIESFRPIWHAVMRSVEWVMKDSGSDEKIDQQWRHIELIPFDVWVKKLQTNKAMHWLDKLGMSIRSTPAEIQAMMTARKDVVSWILSQQEEEMEQPQQIGIRMPPKSVAWLNEADRILKNRWDDCIWNWEERKPRNFQKWTVDWVLAEKMGSLLGEARNEMAEKGSENRVIKEGWGSAMSGWTQTLKAMLVAGDWVSFGRSILAFIQACNQRETLTFDEKTDITGVAAQVLEELAFKMAWVDLLSGSYEFWSLSKVLKQDLERFWNTYQKGDATIEEAIAFYSLLPDSPPQIGFKKEYASMFFQDILENVDSGQPQEMIVKEGFGYLLKLIRGISGDDSLFVIEKWREWAEEQAPEWFDENDFEEEEIQAKEILEKMTQEILKSRRWSPDQKRRLQQTLLL